MNARSEAVTEPWVVKWALVLVATGFLGLFVVVPVAAVFVEAFAKGPGAYLAALVHPETRSAIRLSLLTAAVAIPVNVVFGLAAAHLIARYEFPLKGVLVTLIELPFSVSPVIAGLVFVLLFGSHGVFGPLLEAYQVKVIFAVPGIALATTFVTLPFVAREVLPVMQSQGHSEEEAALTLGATGWQTFFRVTLPKVRWPLLTGIILCNARAMGEFGAVSVVSGHVRGLTNTLPLQVEILYNEYDFAAAFAVASLLTVLAVVTLVVKKLLEHVTPGAQR